MGSNNGNRICKKKKFTPLAEELHRSVKRKFKKRRVLVSGIDKIWAADLADMSNKKLSKENDGYNFLLHVIDTFSKYGWIIPLKDKKPKTVVEAFKTILSKEGKLKRKPEKLWTDKGTEFKKEFNDLLKTYNIELYHTENEEKSSIVERWIRTMKDKIWKYFTDSRTIRYIDVLPDLLEDYNNTVHSSTEFTPIDASKKKN